MMKQEFEKLVGREVTVAQYDRLEEIYMRGPLDKFQFAAEFLKGAVNTKQQGNLKMRKKVITNGQKMKFTFDELLHKAEGIKKEIEEALINNPVDWNETGTDDGEISLHNRANIIRMENLIDLILKLK